MDVPIHFSNVIEFQALIEELKNQIWWLHNVLKKEWLHKLRFWLTTSILAEKAKVVVDHA